MALKDTSVAYLLYVLSFFGIAGLHRFYTGNYITGIIWLFTCGLFFIGTIFDLFYTPTLVEAANQRIKRGD